MRVPRLLAGVLIASVPFSSSANAHHSVGQADIGTVNEAWAEIPFGMTPQLDLSPDGRHAAFVVVENGPDGREIASVRVISADEQRDVQVRSGIVHLPRENAPTFHRLRPRWSPDSRRLAFLAPSGSHLALNVWDLHSGETRIFAGSTACSESCPIYRLQWSPDSQRVYFLAMPEAPTASIQPTDPEFVESPLQLRRRLLIEDQEHHGVSMLESPVQASVGGGAIWSDQTMVAAADLRDNSVRPLISGGRFDQLIVSPDGRRLLISSLDASASDSRQTYRSFYVISVDADDLRVSNSQGSTPARSVGPILSGFKAWTNFASWAPDSDRFAVAEVGALGEGDIYVGSVSRGEVRNLTAGNPVETQVGGTAALGDNGATARLFDYPGKFGRAFQAPIWSADGQHLLILRQDRIDQETLYSIDSVTGLSRAVANLDLSVTGIFNRGGIATSRILVSGRIAGTVGHARRVIAGVAQDRFSIVPLSNTEGRDESFRNISVSGDGDMIAFVEESATQRPALVLWDVRTSRSVRSLTLSAHDTSTRFTRRILSYRGAAGDPRHALLYLPEAARTPGTRVPLVMEVYPSENSEGVIGSRALRYGLSPRVLSRTMRELLGLGFAILIPSVGVSGGGNTCRDVATDVVAALDSAVANAPIAGDRVGIYGYSFGGWAVNCAITRTQRFAAAVSAAGPSNLVLGSSSLSNLYASAGAIGGGQAGIGATIEDRPDLYVQESPALHTRQVTTPLLLLQGKDDVWVPMEQAVSMFSALRDRDATARLVAIDGVDHVTLGRHPRFQSEVNGWFRRFLGSRETDR